MLEWAAIPSSRDLPDPEFKPASPALQVGSLTSEPLWKPRYYDIHIRNKYLTSKGALNFNLLHEDPHPPPGEKLHPSLQHGQRSPRSLAEQKAGSTR